MDIRKYHTLDGRRPFDEWINGLRDPRAIAKILNRLDRVSLGTFGEWASVGNGVCELKERTGPGYRIYYGQDGETVVILLCGGNKSTQRKDISRATDYWNEYLRSKPK